MKKLLVFVNPHSRQGAACLKEVESWLSEQKHVVLNQLGADEDVSDQIRRYAQEASTVIVGGGDGSINRALPALMETGLPLLILPLGTANNLARTLNIPEATRDALAVLGTGHERLSDVGLVNNIPFMTVVGVGLSTKVNHLTQSHWKRWIGKLAFIFTALRVALRMVPFKMTIRYDGQVHTARSWQLTVCNGKTYGTNLPIAQDASLTDKRLHGLSSEMQSLWQGFGLIPYLLKGQFPSHLPVTSFSGQEIVVTTRHSHRADVDGDIRTTTPLTIKVAPRALKVLVPRPEPASQPHST